MKLVFTAYNLSLSNAVWRSCSHTYTASSIAKQWCCIIFTFGPVINQALIWRLIKNWFFSPLCFISPDVRHLWTSVTTSWRALCLSQTSPTETNCSSLQPASGITHNSCLHIHIACREQGHALRVPVLNKWPPAFLFVLNPNSHYRTARGRDWPHDKCTSL